MTTKQKNRHDYFYCINGKEQEQRQVMRFDSVVKIRANKGFNLTKKQFFIVKILNQMPQQCTQTTDSLTNAWLKEKRKLGNFDSADVVNGSDIKKAIQFIYFNYSKLFEYGTNSKGNYTVKQVAFIDNLTELKVIKD